VDGALVAAGIQTHGTHKFRTRQRTLADQDAAGSIPDQEVKGAINCGEHFPKCVCGRVPRDLMVATRRVPRWQAQQFRYNPK